MKLVDYLKRLDLKISDSVLLEINKVTCDSRKCDCNSLYINVNNDYLLDAVKRGVQVVVSSSYIEISNLIVIYVKDIKSFYFQALRAFYNIDHGIKIGVTGTCGKTTTVTLLYESLKRTGKDLLLISSNGNYVFVNNTETFYETVNTTPNIEVIYELIDKYNYDYVIIEVSSQGLMMNRLEGIYFDVCCFLNLSNEHLDYHMTLSSYLNAKMKLFKKLKTGGIGLVNYHSKFKDLFYLDNSLVYSFGIDKGDYKISVVQASLEKMKLKIMDKDASTYLTGDYNAENISCVNGLLNVLGIESKYLIDVLNDGFKMNGRFEIIEFLDNKIIVDFAHTEKEVEVLLKHLKRFESYYNHLYLIVGCGGDRDKTKRPIIGRLCVNNGDFVIFTEDNNRSEKGIDIINDMTRDLNKENFLSILNRYEAIKYGISLLNHNDLLVIIGKGIDKSFVNNKWLSDSEIVKEVINSELN